MHGPSMGDPSRNRAVPERKSTKSGRHTVKTGFFPRTTNAFLPRLDPMVPMTVVAACIGAAGAFAVEGFRQALYGIVTLYSGQEHLVAAAAVLPGWARVLIPTVGATIGGLIMWAAARWVHRPRGPEYMEAVRVGDGTLPLAPNLLRTVSSLAGVSGGITIGREGTMIQFAAVVASVIGTLLHERSVYAEALGVREGAPPRLGATG